MEVVLEICLIMFLFMSVGVLILYIVYLTYEDDDFLIFVALVFNKFVDFIKSGLSAFPLLPENNIVVYQQVYVPVPVDQAGEAFDQHVPDVVAQV